MTAPISPGSLAHIVRCLVLADVNLMDSARVRNELRELYGDDAVMPAWSAAMREVQAKAKSDGQF